MRELSMAQAINEALCEELVRDPTLFLIGEDIGQRGGAFSVTRGLYLDFPGRVIDTPISENAIAGMVLGAAITGCAAVAEFMYSDFSLCGIDHILNSAAKFRHMFGAQGHVPAVFRMPGGGGRQNAAQHSQSLEALFANVPGLKLVMPSCPHDAKGLLKASVRDGNPVIFMEHKAIYFRKGEVPEEDYTLPLGKGVIRRCGGDLTVVATGIDVGKALEAAEQLAAQGVEAEVIDLRTLVPYDRELVFSSVARTGRLLVTHESPEQFGVGGEIVAAVAAERFAALKAPPTRVCGKYLPHSYNRRQEEYVLPGVEQLVARALETVCYTAYSKSRK